MIAMNKDNLKARLAFSTVSQLSYVTLGAMLATSMGGDGRGDANRRACAWQDDALYVCRRCLCCSPQDAYLGNARAWPGHAVYVWRVFHWRDVNHRPAAHGRILAQVFF